MSTASEPSTATKTLVPPEETLWKRYSPHHEAPLSGVTSVALHVLALGGIALIAAIDMKCNDPDALDLEKRSAPANNAKFIPIEPVRVTDGGGGGNRDVKDRGPGGTKDGPDVPPEVGDPSGTKDGKARVLPPDHVAFNPAKQQGIREEFTNDANIIHLVKNGTEMSNFLLNQEKQVRQALRRSVNPGGGAGGVGQDGGRDSGRDKGVGPHDGPGKGQLTQREKRMLRWAMTFNTQDGQDYRRQLQGLGAILAFPVPNDSQRFLLMHNLNDPKSAKVDDISGLNRIFWVDERPASVRSLCNALQMQPAPPFFAAFFPEALEARLLELELAYLLATKGKRDEDLVHETRFDVFPVGGGKYDVRVKGQTLR